MKNYEKNNNEREDQSEDFLENNCDFKFEKVQNKELKTKNFIKYIIRSIWEITKKIGNYFKTLRQGELPNVYIIL